MKPLTDNQPQNQISLKPNIHNKQTTQTNDLQLDDLTTKEVGNRPAKEPTQNDNDNSPLTTETETNNKPYIRKGNFAHVITDV